MRQVKNLFKPKRPGRRMRKQYPIPHHEDRKQRMQWERERIERNTRHIINSI